MTQSVKPSIIPAIIAENIYDLEEKVSLVKGAVSEVHLDVCDGIFVPSVSWPKRGDKIFSEMVTGEDRGLPSWAEVDYEIHLMTAHPEHDVFDWINAGASKILIQLESFLGGKQGQTGDDVAGLSKLDEMLKKLEADYNYNPEIDDDFFQIGLCIGLNTDLELLAPYAKRVNYLQVMSISKIGFQGQKFDERVYDRLREIAVRFGDQNSDIGGDANGTENPKMISVDGGVSIENAVNLAEAGATRLIVGSAIYENDVPVVAVEELQNLLRS
jgi:ribulose-phosphate 3-epimerase